MKTARKALLLALCAVLLVGATVMGTMAYLTSTQTVTNTFTVGKVAITLDEAKVDTNGTPDVDAARVTTNEYKLIPGHTYIKDPTIHVASDSEDCWLFVKVENGIAAIENTASTIAAQMKANGWTPVAEGSNVYCRAATNKAGDDVVVFGSFKVADDANVASYAGENIVVTAYAIQADGFDTAAAAWAAAKLS